MKTGNPVANEEDFQKVANKVSTITIIGNIALSLLKLFAGIVAHSNAMISDAIHSASDVFSTFVVIIGIRLASKKPDKEHPYGHERLECVAAIVLAIVLLITGLGIGIEAFKTILQGNSDNIQTVHVPYRSGQHRLLQGCLPLREDHEYFPLLHMAFQNAL